MVTLVRGWPGFGYFGQGVARVWLLWSGGGQGLVTLVRGWPGFGYFGQGVARVWLLWSGGGQGLGTLVRGWLGFGYFGRGGGLGQFGYVPMLLAHRVAARGPRTLCLDTSPLIKPQRLLGLRDT